MKILAARSAFTWALAMLICWFLPLGGAPRAWAQAPAGEPSEEGEPSTEAVAADPAGSEAPESPDSPEPSEKLDWDPQPASGEWEVDEQGRQYYVDAMPKEGLRYQHLEDGRVRISWGFYLDLVDEDEEFFYYKVYRTDHVESKRMGGGPTKEELAAIAADYDVTVEESEELTFKAAHRGLPESGQWRQGFVVADMNGDGHLDIVHGPARASLGSPVVFLGDSEGNWKPWQDLRFPSVPFSYGDVAVADFNGDGHADLAVTCHFQGMVAMVGDGSGRFELWSEGIDFQPPGRMAAGGFSARSVEVIDWNRDGRPDLLALGEGPRLNLMRTREQVPKTGSRGVVLYLNQGDGTWVRKDQGTGAGKIYGDSLATGDFNGDGRTDFVTGSNIFGRRDIVHLAAEDGSWEVLDSDLVRPRGYQRAVAAADVTGDGRDDVIVGYTTYEGEQWRTGLDVLSLPKGGTWSRSPVDAIETSIGFYAVSAGDLNGDGRADLIALDGNGASRVYLGRDEGGFVREKSPELQVIPKDECRGFHTVLADFDGDGRDEVISAFAGEPKALYQTRGCEKGGALTAWDPEHRAASSTPATTERPAGGD